MCDEKWILCETSNDQLSGWTKKKFKSTSQSQTCTKKRPWSVFGVLLPICSATHYSFLNPGETITSEKYARQIDDMHWKLQCLQPELVNRMGPILLHDNAWQYTAQPTLQKLNKLGGLQTFASSAIFTWHLVNWLPCLQASQQLFVGKMLPLPAGGRKCFPRVHSAPEPWIFMLQE